MPARGSRGGPAGSDLKMVLIVRAELRLTPGKAATQVAHAAVQLARLAERSDRDTFDAWWAAGQKKIVLSASNLDEMRGLERAARAAHLPVAWVEDAGLTEVAPGTTTVLGIGPGPSVALDRVTGQLDLY